MATHHTPTTDNADKLYELIDHFNNAMLVTRAQNGTLRARPMALADRDKQGRLWFITHGEAAKVDELEANPMINVTMQDGQRYVSLSGRARVEKDRAKLDALWSPAYEAWFPEGKNDDVALIEVRPQIGEYWDGSGFKNTLRYAFESARALVQDDTPSITEGQHDKVKL